MNDDFRRYVETLIANNILERITDFGVTRLLRIYRNSEYEPPASLIREAEMRQLAI